MEANSWRNSFLAGLGFVPDQFQLDSFASLDSGHSVLVAAPTGSGKTLVAEYAVESARASGKRVFYTAPIKALSNQKYRDFVERYGIAEVGLLTGDNSINPQANVVVMTTEVLRNMIYAGSNDLDNLYAVVLDEVHYIQDTYRGQVWEEIIVHLPQEVLLVCLSATVSNAREIADWISTVRGRTDFVISDHRPVPLESRYAAFDRETSMLRVEPVLIDGVGNPHVRRIESMPVKSRNKSKTHKQRLGTPTRAEIVDNLDEEDLLPAIFFIFSRAQCDEAAHSLVADGFDFNNSEAKRRVEDLIDVATQGISDEDLLVLGIEDFESALIRGIGSHHAGMIAPLKECVERAFLEGLVRVVFATETLAVGINMPARAVVIEKVTRFRGEHHEILSAADFTQLTGRAGRRGLDSKGVALICANPFVRFDTVAGLVANREFNLRSAFKPSCNMATNLIATHSQREAQHLLNLSLAQFQSDKEIVLLERRRERLEAELRSFGVNDPDAEISMQRFDLGDLVYVDSVAYQGLVAVVAIADRNSGTRITTVDTEAERITFDLVELSEFGVKAGKVALPIPYVPQRRDFVVEVARLASAHNSGHHSSRRAGPSNRKSDKNTLKRLLKDINQISAKQTSMAGSVSARFADVTRLLTKRGFIDGWTLTEKGSTLRNVFHELDVVIAEVLWCGVLEPLTEADLVVLMSAFVYESRSRDTDPSESLPPKHLRDAGARLRQIHRQINGQLEEAMLAPLRELDFGMSRAILAWFNGESLSTSLSEEDYAAGDFVRAVRNLIDLLNQVAEIAPSAAVRQNARFACEKLDRGVVKLAVGVG
jgi:ATP-dependent RNA helicase HelY